MLRAGCMRGVSGGPCGPGVPDPRAGL